ncbi:MAG TPA: adenylate/guanylate cyclase domain-containing protein [Micromonosporaceae bacterium]|nr:adenylate/guanylate cyclase domain-containing protein [Micromonosporaceae bacterium]
MAARIHLPSGQVTFLFTDIEGSTRLAQMLGPGYRPVLTEHRRLLQRTLSASDGATLFTEGDSIFVAFSNAAAALAACAEAQRVLASHEWPTPQARPLVRMGLHTGYAEPHGGEYASPEVHRAARVAAAAHGGQVLCSAATALSAQDDLPDGAWLLDLGLHRLRGFDDRERLYQLVAPGLERQFPRPRTVDAAAHNLPSAVTTFVGRSGERAELHALVAEQRLATVVGAGGAGKTRLALEVARDLVVRHPDGVWFVDLAAVTDPGLVAFEIAAVFGLRPEPGRPVLDTLAEYASTRSFLLNLDTCDAQLGAASAVASRLLATSRGVLVLATSREPLGMPGETVWRIPPLSLRPGPDGAPSDAVALLLDRTAAARGGRRAGADEIVHLERVAARLDGLPLALELAAARLRVLSASQLADRIDSELPGRGGDVLSTLDAGSQPDLDEDEPANTPGTVCLSSTPPPHPRRHATLHATMAWSYRTLGRRAATMLRWLSVFAGPVDLAAVEWLLDDDPLDPLAVLVDKSLVQADGLVSGTTYRMLDPIRAYAARRLADAGEERFVRDRHVAWSLHALQRVHLGADSRPLTLSMYALDPLAMELRSALRWTVTGGSARQGLQLAGGLDQWWRERGLAREGRLWLFRLYGRIAETGEQIPEAELAAAYHMHSLHAGADGEYAEELRFSQRAEAAARQAGDVGLLARVLAGRGAPLLDMGQPDKAEHACREVIEWAEEHGVAGEALFAVYCLAQLLWQRGALDEAADLLAAARPVEAARPIERGRRTVDLLLGMVALARGDLVAAHDHLMVALRARIGYGFHSRACEAINAIAVRCALGGDPLAAAQLFGATQAARARLRSPSGVFATYWTEQQSAVRAAVGDAAFDSAYAAGVTLTLEEAAAVALAVEHPDLAADSSRFAASGPLDLGVMARIKGRNEPAAG